MASPLSKGRLLPCSCLRDATQPWVGLGLERASHPGPERRSRTGQGTAPWRVRIRSRMRAARAQGVPPAGTRNLLSHSRGLRVDLRRRGASPWWRVHIRGSAGTRRAIAELVGHPVDRSLEIPRRPPAPKRVCQRCSIESNRGRHTSCALRPPSVGRNTMSGRNALEPPAGGVGSARCSPHCNMPAKLVRVRARRSSSLTVTPSSWPTAAMSHEMDARTASGLSGRLGRSVRRGTVPAVNWGTTGVWMRRPGRSTSWETWEHRWLMR